MNKDYSYCVGFGYFDQPDLYRFPVWDMQTAKLLPKMQCGGLLSNTTPKTGKCSNTTLTLRVMSKSVDLYQQWADAFASIGNSHITNDTAAKILAVVYVYGGSFESFTHCPTLMTDLKAATRMFHIDGGVEPSPYGIKLIKQYVRELEEDIYRSSVCENDSDMFSTVCHVKWANKLFKERYGFEKLLL